MINQALLFNSILQLINLHPSVKGKAVLEELEEGNYAYRIGFTISISLPRDFQGIGVTDKGIKNEEECYIYLKRSFPATPPRIALRKDFPREFPHINPGAPDDYVNPCIYDGNLADLIYHPEWFNEILNHLSTWLNKAARDDLLDSEQGWEPIRRDKDSSKLLLDEATIKSQINSSKSLKTRIFDFEYHSFTLPNNDSYFYGSILNENNLSSTINSNKNINKVTEHTENVRKANHQDLTHFISIGIVAWSDDSYICTDYFPDSVTTMEELIARAETYGLDISYQLRNLAGLIQGKVERAFYIVILAVRRPVKLIGSSSNIELISYLIKTTKSNNLEITPITNIYKANPRILAELSGITGEITEQKIGLIGLGSLGSKIGLHLARAGFPSFSAFDNSELLPHNQARHALIHRKWENYKVILFKALTEQMGTNVETNYKDFREISSTHNLLSDTTNYSIFIDTTASDEISNTLVPIKPTDESVPLVQARLYSEGKMATISTEGYNRLPRIDDIEAILITSATNNSQIFSNLFGKTESGFDLVRIGEGCASATLKMSDAKLSIFAAGIAERITDYLTNGLPEQGELLVGLLDEIGIGTRWSRIKLPTFEQFVTDDGWFIRISTDIIDDMKSSLEAGKPNETGGVLIGKISWPTHTITITKTLPAPEDSICSPTLFELGTKGLKERLGEIHETSNNHLTYVGTWHTHPMGGSASRMDKNTLHKLTQERSPIPTVCIIVSDKIELVPGNAT